MSTGLNETQLRRLRWRARRGLLENDLILERFLTREGDALDPRAAAALQRLLELGDNELLDLLLERAQLRAPLDTEDVRALLARLRQVTA
ncbi:MAG TPA: succinate dehydrogenase assembly factor 2 [Burkholderiaceae bacterium]|jgi:antitoxin CptB|nr:succinate dehydrogenase assembly factor 2 [Burkholderiaceae bacterium]